MSHLKNLSRNIFIALLLGALTGIFFPAAANYVSFLGLIFKSSLSMIVMPIILTSILCGMESLGDVKKFSGLGLKTVIYFLSTTFIAIFIGLSLVSIISPGVKPPSPAIKNLVLSSTGNTTLELADDIVEKVSTELQYPKDSALRQDLSNSLKNLANNHVSKDELKEGALRLIGSLELRSRLDEKQRPKQIQQMAIHEFVTLQIKRAIMNPFKALAEQDVVAVIVFTLLLGAAMTAIGPLNTKFFQVNRAVNTAVMKIVEWIMYFAPFGVFGLIVEVISSTGFDVLSKLGFYAMCVILGLSIHLFIILPSINFVIARRSPIEFFKAVRPAMMVAFSTSSSSATLPVTIQCVEQNLKIDKRISQFVLPLGATVNMDGTALYEAVAAVFIAQLYGVSLGFESQIIVAITAALASMGSAGIPAAGTVTMALVLSAVGLPIEGIGLLLAIDRPLDMCRTVINVTSDAIGCSVMQKIVKLSPEIEAVGKGYVSVA